MKKLFLFLALAASLALPARGALIFSPSSASFEITPGQSFTFTISALTDLNLYGFALFFESEPDDEGFFSVTAATPASGFAYSFDPLNPVIIPPDLPSEILTSGTVDLGAQRTGSQLPAGTYALSLLTIQSVIDIPLGTYTLTIPTLSGTYDQSFAFTAISTPSTFTVTVVPEPSSLALLAAAPVLPLLRRLRRK